MSILIGLISDTHGLLRPTVPAAFDGVHLILHAGDVGSPDVLDGLQRIAPVEAVSGNVDGPELMLPRAILRDVGALTVHVSHGDEVGSPTPDKLARRYGADVVVFGHTHRAVVQRIGQTLVVNPGAAGPRRFDLKPSVALLIVDASSAQVEIVELPS